MKIAIAQLNVTVGDLDGNAAKINDAARRAKASGASLLLTTELALSGYPPEDLLLRDDFFHACDKVFQRLVAELAGITVVLGHPHQISGKRYNAASVIRDGKVIATYLKRTLPNYTVFDEERYFDSGDSPCVFEHEGVRVGINICADVWEEPAARAARDAGAQLLLVLNASPYHINKQLTRYEVVRERIGKTGMAVIYANQVGGEDVYSALTMGVRDYLGKNGFPGALLGLSGGIDSALTLAVAVDALGADKVHAVMMPSQYTADMSCEDAKAQAQIMGTKYSEIAIRPMFDGFLTALADEFRGLKEDVTEENLQARIRGTLLMAMSNKTGAIVLTTGNKSEMGTGYATLYGDMAGGFAVLKDIKKTLVYRLCEYRNTLSAVIPRRVIDRPPSAELRPDQKDQDSLPPYDVLDAIMEAYVEQYRSPQEIIAMGFARADVDKVVRLLRISEYKRRQAPVGIRITNRGFGKDWRYPITNKFRH